MTDWEKYKVAELKEECKSRQISLAGLKLKQHYIDKLVEYETSFSQDAAPAEESVAKTNGAFEEVAEDDMLEEPAKPERSEDIQADRQDHTDDENGEDDNKHDAEQDATEDNLEAVKADTTPPEDHPTTLTVGDSRGVVAEAQVQEDAPMTAISDEATEIKQNDVLVTQPEQLTPNQDAQPELATDTRDTVMEDAEEKSNVAQDENVPSPISIVDSMEQDQDGKKLKSPHEEELRKRKRRSVTPPPDAEEVQKKVKLAGGEAVVTKRALRSPSPKSPSIKATLAVVTDIPEETTITQDAEMRVKIKEHAPQPEESKEDQAELTDKGRMREPSIDKERSIEPSMHAATRSLYIRNFKRPLNIQTLRTHIVTIAQGSSAAAAEESPIKFFNVNNIRSHAFITFSSMSAASRVRAAMHQTRFPEEPQRDPLWIDFVPDEKVQEWVEQETGGSRALGRNTSAKLEVVYNQTDDGIEAIFQEVDGSRPQRPSIGTGANQRSSISQRAAYSADPSRTTAIASGIHPDRAGIVPISPRDRRRSSPARQAVPIPQKPRDEGIGFKGLDDLFESTQAKPKLYYKPPPQSVVDQRLDMIKGLFSDRGVSGDPGMKRYTFERDRGREEWVDNGPEFGHGKRGADRLAGVGSRGRGGFRGRGGGRGFFGGDSYRGGGRR